MSLSSTTRPKTGVFSKPPNGMFVHKCDDCQQHFYSKHKEFASARNKHQKEGRGSCTAVGIRALPLLNPVQVDDILHVMPLASEGDLLAGDNLVDEPLTEHIDWKRIGLDSQLTYSSIELNEHVKSMLLRETGGIVSRTAVDVEHDIDDDSKTLLASDDFAEFQMSAEKRFAISEAEKFSLFNLRNDVKWQDVLSLQMFALEANLTEALGTSLLVLLRNLIERHGLQQIPMLTTWKGVDSAVNRKVVPEQLVSTIHA
jgi:hypothetical protein